MRVYRARRANAPGIKSLANPSALFVRKLLTVGTELSLSGEIGDAIEALKAAHKAATDLHDPELAAEALEGLCRQSWANANSSASLDYARILLDLPLPSTSTWRIQGFLRLARTLTALGRPREALEILRDATKECDYTRLGSLSTYLEVRAYAEWAAHMKSAALRDFQLAIDMAAALHDNWALAFMLNNFGTAAAEFGETELAHEVHRRAIAIASEQNLGWVVPYAKLTYAQNLLLFGDFREARAIVDETAAEESEHPSVAIKRSWVRGLLDGIAAKPKPGVDWDEAMLDVAFKSSEPARICPMVAAYHKHYAAHETMKARSLLSKALSTLKSSAFAVWLALEVARYGTLEQTSTCAKIFEDRGSEDEVANGVADLLQAHLAGLRGDAAIVTRRAGQAEAIFRKHGLQYPEAIAMELGGRPRDARKAYDQFGALLEAARLKADGLRSARSAVSLTGRQQEVVRLILRGHNLKQVAEALGIARKTAEHHLMAAMQTLGVQHRADLRSSPQVAHLI